MGLKTLYETKPFVELTQKTLWHIPVCYADFASSELKAFAAHKGMNPDTVVSLHTAPIYVLYFVGFLPGFLYLGGLDERLFLDRKPTPAMNIPKGAVAIGGEQTGIYPQTSPGGWHILGRSPVVFFNVNKHAPCLFFPGDRIRFFAIDGEKYNAIGSLIDQGVYLPKSEIYEG